MSVNSSTFSSVLKLADVTPVYKKDSQKKAIIGLSCPTQTIKNENILENILCNQIAPYLEKTFSKYETGFRKVLIHGHI